MLFNECYFIDIADSQPKSGLVGLVDSLNGARNKSPMLEKFLADGCHRHYPFTPLNLHKPNPKA